MAYGKTVSDAFQALVARNDRREAEGKDRNLKVEQLKMQKEQQEQAAAMDRFNQAFKTMESERNQENVLAARADRSNESARQQENFNTQRQDKLDQVLQKEDFSVLDREDRQQHAMELANLNADNKMKQVSAKEATKNAPKTVSERFLKLNGEQGKAVNSTIMALKGVDDSIKALTDGSNTFSIVGDNEFTQARAQFVEGLARMQTGAAISADEEKRFTKMLPTLADPPKIRAKKFNDMRQMLQGRLRRYGFERSDFDELANDGASASVDAIANPDQARKRLQELRSKYGR